MQRCTISGNVNGTAIMENSDSQKKKKKILLQYDPAITLLDIYSKEIKSLSCTNICSPPCNIIYNSQDMKPAHIFFLMFENESQSTISQVF